jgi:hypothetical protein
MRITPSCQQARCTPRSGVAAGGAKRRTSEVTGCNADL